MAKHVPDHTLLQELYTHILKQPENNSLRRRYAEALPLDHPHAQLIMAQLEQWYLERSNIVRETPRRRLIDLHRLQDKLLATYTAEWTAPLAALGSKFQFVRGFIEAVTLSPEAFVQHGKMLLEAAPIVSLDLVGTTGFEQLCESPLLDHILSLNLFSQKLGDTNAQRLASSVHARSLRYLDLGYCNLTEAGVAALAASPNLPHLQYVNLTSNRCENPVEEAAGIDGDHIEDYIFPAFGQRLEQQYGPQRWLHYTPQNTYFLRPMPRMFIGQGEPINTTP